MLQVNSEFYTGWLDHWGDQHAAVDQRKVSVVLAEMLVMGANVNMCVVLHIDHTVTDEEKNLSFFLLFFLPSM